jgi:NAD(P)H-dependent FMN reductase/AraC-like DNA-binding protein
VNALPERPIRILVLGGSHSRPSHTRCLTEAVRHVLDAAGAATVVWDLAARELPAVGSERARAGATALRLAAVEADGLVVATPLYHGSYSGLLKNALDHLRREEVGRKPVGIMSTSASYASPRAADHLRVVIRSLGGAAIPTDVVAADADFARIGDCYRVTNAGLSARIRSFATELLWFSERLCLDPGHHELPANGNGHRHNGRADGNGCNGDAGPPQLRDQIAHAVAYIRANFADGELSLSAVAREACMSRYHFSRTFRTETGTRFIDFLTMLRLGTAASLLADTEESVTSICFSVGYRDLSHFERIFKKRFGVCPSEYRARAGSAAEPELVATEALAP